MAATQISLLRATNEHGPEELVFVMAGGHDDGVPFELPCFAMAISIDLSGSMTAAPPCHGAASTPASFSIARRTRAHRTYQSPRRAPCGLARAVAVGTPDASVDLACN